MSINVNDEVKVVSNNGGDSAMTIGYTGKVIRLYDLITPIAIVKFNNGITAKIPVNDLIKVETQVNQENKIPEGAKRITKAEFIEAVHDLTSPGGSFGRVATEVDPLFGLLGGMSAMITGMKIADRIFKDQEVVTITEDQFTEAIWDNCSPAKLAESSNMSVRECMKVSLLSINALDDLIEIFFGDGSGNA